MATLTYGSQRFTDIPDDSAVILYRRIVEVANSGEVRPVGFGPDDEPSPKFLLLISPGVHVSLEMDGPITEAHSAVLRGDYERTADGDGITPHLPPHPQAVPTDPSDHTGGF